MQPHAFGDVLELHEQFHLIGNGQPKLFCTPFSQGGDVGQPLSGSSFLYECFLEFAACAAAGKQDGDLAPSVLVKPAELGHDAVKKIS